jgi:hypothetical protein
MPRPSKLNDILQKNLVDAVRAGNFYSTACRAYGVGESTFHRWMSDPAPRYRAFQDAITRAAAAAEAEAIGQIRLASRKDWRAAAWFLEKKYPKEWGNQIKAEISGPEGGPIQVDGRVLNVNLDKLPPELLEALVLQLEEGDPDDLDGEATESPRADPATG